MADSPVWGGAPMTLFSYVGGNGHAMQGLPPEVLTLIARGVPSMPWMFPRAGTDPNASWTAADVLVQTPSKNYSAFDYLTLMLDLDQDDAARAAVEFLVNDPDMLDFAAPGVDTFVGWGSGSPTPTRLALNRDISGGVVLDATMLMGDGDGIVPVRSSLRSTQWRRQQAAAGKQLVIREYPGMPHASCIPRMGGGGPAPRASTQCWLDAVDWLETLTP